MQRNAKKRALGRILSGLAALVMIGALLPASGETEAATVDETQTVETTNGSTTATKTVPKYISFTIPDAMKGQDGVYMSMYVDAMGYAPDAYLKIDYASAVKSGDASRNYTTEVATAKVERFGEYNVTAQVTVADGEITVGAKALYGINKKAVIKVPKKAYTKLFKGKDQKKTVKIK